MNMWGHLSEYAHNYLLVMVSAVTAISFLRRRRRPEVDELYKLGKAFLGTMSALFVLGYLCPRKSSELGGLSLAIMIGTLPHAYGSLVALAEIVGVLWKKEQTPISVQEVAPVPPKREH